MLAAAAVASLGAGCTFDADYGDTQLMCPESSPRCPAGYTCVNTVCVVPGGPDAATDGAGPDAGVCELAAMEGENDGCGASRDLTAAASAAGGTVAHGDTTGYVDDLTPSTLPDCTGSPEPGPDAIFRVNLVVGESLAVTLTTDGWLGDVYVTDACTQIADCLDGAMQNTAVTVGPVGTAGTYYIVVDARTAGVSGCFSLSATITP
jgi:hypothetical protein